MTDTSNGGTPDPDEIERDIERTRADMQDTLDALQRKLSPGQMVDEALDYFRQGPGDFLQILGATVKHNPVPVALLGIGLGWLMLAGPRRPPPAVAYAGRARDDGGAVRGERDYRDYQDYRDYDELTHPGAFEDRYYMAETTPGGGARVYAPPSEATGDGGVSAGRPPSTMERLGARASELAHEARDKVAGLAGGVRERFGGGSHDTSSGVSSMARSARDTVSDMAESAQDTVSRAADTVSQAAKGTADRLGRAAGATREATQRLGQTASEQAGRAGEGFTHLLYNNPIVVGAVGVAVGLALGYALPSTRREDEVLGPRRDELLDRAREAGEEGLHKAQEVGTRVYETAKEEVRKQAGLSDQEETSGQAGAAEEQSGRSGGPEAGFGAEPGYKPAGEEPVKASPRSKRSGSSGS